MPFITDEELLNLQVQIDEAKEEKRATNFIHTKAIRDEKDKTKKFKIATIILGIIALLGIAGTIYFLNFNTPENAISKLKHENTVADLNDKIAELEENVKTLSLSPKENEEAASETAGSLEGALVYAVQIGAFVDKDLSLYSEGFANFREIRSGDYNKYALGNFESLEEAKQFRRELLKLGFRDAFIASYQDNQRVKIEEAY
ncbi:SPOR domain-containing protein [Aquimarina hainanensis]|uniref:SPOR domain-containing protein n=1 Tax=Aquimarina hainanensis TaxID=1578017 RepID=A0ABW5N961_9FLAO|nr:SPOR domain-containing protein [Aquimarina sp. TRL1]QKX03843.1 SPOR domain-containing protein [Aquimarina sp. TRL1]